MRSLDFIDGNGLPNLSTWISGRPFFNPGAFSSIRVTKSILDPKVAVIEEARSKAEAVLDFPGVKALKGMHLCGSFTGIILEESVFHPSRTEGIEYPAVTYICLTRIGEKILHNESVKPRVYARLQKNHYPD
jgi:hypothetical protein